MDKNLQKSTESSLMIQKNYFETESINQRYSQLTKIQSHHFLPIKSINSSIIINKVSIIYKNHEFITLAEYAQDKQLLPSQIKSIIWQITKLMVECEQLKINHLRISNKAIVVARPDKYFNNIESTLKNPFVWLKDFSFGKQFVDVNQGKKLQIFQFLHPSLSINNGSISFSPDQYSSQVDIWSFGVVLYMLIYKVSAFRKEGRDIFSKTILRQFLKKEYEVSFHYKKYRSINQIIQKCLKSQFRKWRQIQKHLIFQQQIYNQVDFRLIPFHQICIEHIRIIYLFSSIYQMILQQNQKSTHPFWKITIQNQNVPFVLSTSLYLLLLTYNIHRRFLLHYHSHLIVLQSNNRTQIISRLQKITHSIKSQIKHRKESLIIPKMFPTEQNSINLQTIKQMRLNFAEIILKTGINYKSISKHHKGRSNEKESFLVGSQLDCINGSRSLQILFDFCDQMISIFNRTKNHTKLLFQHILSSQKLIDIAIVDFRFSFY